MTVVSCLARVPVALSLLAIAACQDLTVGPSDARSPDAALPDAARPDAAMPDATLPDAMLPDAALPDAAVPDATVPDAALPDAAADPCPPACAEIADCAVVQCTLLEAADREFVYTGCMGYCPSFGATLALLTDSTDDCARIVSTVSLNNPLFANTCGAQRE
jgi:hypothetical protein